VKKKAKKNKVKEMEKATVNNHKKSPTKDIKVAFCIITKPDTEPNKINLNLPNPDPGPGQQERTTQKIAQKKK
jgi:hypothetical protein